MIVKVAKVQFALHACDWRDLCNSMFGKDHAVFKLDRAVPPSVGVATPVTVGSDAMPAGREERMDNGD